MTHDPAWQDEREIQIEAAPGDVWAAWAEPAHVARWFADEAHGALEPGGELVHVFHGHGEHRYRVLEVAAPERLVLEGRMMEGEAFIQHVEITYRDGITILRLVHSGFGAVDPDSEIMKGIDSGWTGALALLKLYVERHFGRPKSTLAIFRPASFDYGRLRNHFFSASAGLGAWLTDGAASIEPGRPATLRLHSGSALTGRLLASTDHELSIEWQETDGALELKAFGSAPDQRFVGLRFTSWSVDREATVERLRPGLEAAVSRLVERSRELFSPELHRSKDRAARPDPPSRERGTS